MTDAGPTKSILSSGVVTNIATALVVASLVGGYKWYESTNNHMQEWGDKLTYAIDRLDKLVPLLASDHDLLKTVETRQNDDERVIVDIQKRQDAHEKDDATRLYPSPHR